MKAVGYCRISTEGQSDGLGLDVQRRQVTDHCWTKAYELVETFEDVTSGSNGLEERTALAGALEALEVDGCGVLVVPRLDRLARDLVMQEQLLAEVWRTGAEVESAAEGEANLRDDPEDPSRALIRQVLGAVSEYERKMIVLRMSRGRMAKAARGGFATGSPPYGWAADGHGGLVEVEHEQEVIEIIREMWGAGLNTQQIAEHLNEREIPTKRGPGYKWWRGTVERIIKRFSDDAFLRMVGSVERD